MKLDVKNALPCCLCVLVWLSATMLAQAEGYDSGGFEAPSFSVGSLNGQDKWRVVDVGGSSDDAVVQDQDVYQGKQAIELRNVGHRVVARYTQVHRDVVYVDVMLKLPEAETIKANPTLRLRGRDDDNKAGILVDVQFSAGGKVIGVSGASYTPGAWTRLTVKVDPAANTWDLYLNGELLGKDLSPRGNAGIALVDSFDLDWTSQAGSAGPGMRADNFVISSSDPLAASKP